VEMLVKIARLRFIQGSALVCVKKEPFRTKRCTEKPLDAAV